jgi:hypothetical protein
MQSYVFQLICIIATSKSKKGLLKADGPTHPSEIAAPAEKTPTF